MSKSLNIVELFASQIPSDVFDESGKVFYSGLEAFSKPSELYVLGVNPGGDPKNYAQETVRNHTRQVMMDLPENWSAYRDESWEGAAPGSHGMAPRILHMFRHLGLSPGSIPASNLFFVRSSREAHIKDRLTELSDTCWPFHQLVIERLQPRVILCLGATAGKYVCKKISAHRLVATFVEQNNRRWTSSTFESQSGVRVVIATHPSIADWCTVATDPTGLIQAALK